MIQKLILIGLSVFASASLAQEDWASAEQALRAFHQNSAQFMNEVPQKSRYISKFSNNEILTSDYIDVKFDQRKACTQGPGPDYAPLASPLPNDNVEEFLEGDFRTRNAKELDALNLNKAEVDQIPWSGDYWPYAMGILGQRPFDKKFNRLGTWTERYEYFQKNPLHEIIKRQNADLDVVLSISEKYELILGEYNSFLTQHMWLEGKAYQDEFGKVEEWMGLCHGWAPASYMLNGPKKTLKLKSFDQKHDVEIYPDELKGLASYLWATSPFDTAFVGGRCNDKDPKYDENGRIITKDCFDSNPATWHLAVLHRLGMQKQSFVIDATYDYEVWNQPVVGYTLTYFNPITSKFTDSLNEALIPINSYTGDKFKKYRSQQATHVLGVAMRLGYVVERNVSDNESEPPPYSDVVWVEYLYDLEVDSRGDIIGGEWYTNLHPDFLWTPKKGAKATSQFDGSLKSTQWDGRGPVPQDWAKVSEASHYHTKQVLSPIIERLIELSQ